VTVPNLGESIVEAEIESWQKKEGDWVARGETLVSVASDKATLEVPSPAGGFLRKILKGDGEVVEIGEVIAELEEAEKPAGTEAGAAPAAPVAEAPAAAAPAPAQQPSGGAAPAGPAARRVMAERGIDASTVQGTGPQGRILKEDAMRAP